MLGCGRDALCCTAAAVFFWGTTVCSSHGRNSRAGFREMHFVAQSVECRVAARWATGAMWHCSFLACVLLVFLCSLETTNAIGYCGEIKNKVSLFLFLDNSRHSSFVPKGAKHKLRPTNVY